MAPTIPDNRRTRVATWSELEDRRPAYALVADVDLVVIRYDEEVSVLYGRCLHRGALLADGSIRGEDLICGVHDWDYRFDTGVSSYNPDEALPKFHARIDLDEDAVFVDEQEIQEWARANPQPYDRAAYLGLYADTHGTPAEPYNKYIQRLAKDGLEKVGHHGPVSAMGVPLTDLPRWRDIQIVTAQLARRPLADDDLV
ncbi:MAG: Rieske (2Fe-2S) protein, partial [Actinobacteria bacterium]|nr:Rieske (2Fe-2S) protein [Gemmatimonadota bacterium]NIU22198.1 Rieske (2Fe-2S) protein [Actinomycetota bacterium]NIU79277.1 Rieske 2Fe-2S domain-containing protein [Gammaproteobacteria bacterium]NIV58745.1 Rieske 2Fe-2S domain-containing protein [Actinomycetota bacterium]NIW36553.1 Rieske 2Fe-2S domain-containing protein [Gemmatimonadota bacterium]